MVDVTGKRAVSWNSEIYIRHHWLNLVQGQSHDYEAQGWSAQVSDQGGRDST